MHIENLIQKLQELENKGFTQCVINDEGLPNLKFEVVATEIDLEGQIVDQHRKDFVQMDPHPIKEMLQVYEEGTFWKDSYPHFKDFYQFMESARLKEIHLVHNAKPIVLIN